VLIDWFDLICGLNVHSFSSAQKTPVNTGGEFKLLKGFASFEIQASKNEIVDAFSGN
jgi:hypothetical protein